MAAQRSHDAVIVRHRVFHLCRGAVFACLSILSACDSSSNRDSDAQVAAPTAPAEQPAPPPPPAPRDVDAKAVLSNLDCPSTTLKNVCRLMEQFDTAGEWSWRKPAGEARWIGRAYRVEQGRESESLLLLWAGVIPTAQAGPGELPMAVGTGTVPDRLASHGEKLLLARSRGHNPSLKNQARPFVDSFKPTKTWRAMKSSGTSIVPIAAKATYVREKERRVYFIQLDEQQSARPGDGLYAEMWIATW